MSPTDLYIRLGVALGIGLLVGLQREHAGPGLAGVRTFPLIAIFGALCGLMAVDYGAWPIVAGLIALAAMTIAANVARQSGETQGLGTTTSVAVLVVFGLGAYLMNGLIPAAVVMTGVVVVLLHHKPQMHAFVDRLGEKDFRAIMQFVLVSLIVLPLLPNRNYGLFGYEVWNPRTIWLLVVLIVGIGVGGYLAYKFLGERAGLVLGGVLGGVISSTATTFSYARRTGGNANSSGALAVVIMFATTAMFVRVLVELSAVAPRQMASLTPPILTAAGACVVIAAVGWWSVRGQRPTLAEQENPSELKSALVFAALFAVVLLAIAFAKDRWGDQGLYVVAIISGITRMDAITLSAGQMVSHDAIDVATGWRLVLTAWLANLAFKAAIVAAVGGRNLLRYVAPMFAAAFVAGLAILVFWP